MPAPASANRKDALPWKQPLSLLVPCHVRPASLVQSTAIPVTADVGVLAITPTIADVRATALTSPKLDGSASRRQLRPPSLEAQTPPPQICQPCCESAQLTAKLPESADFEASPECRSALANPLDTAAAATTAMSKIAIGKRAR